jgi:hypothetical protein
MDNFDLKKYLAEGKLNEGALMDESSLERKIQQYVSQVSERINELDSLNPQQSLDQIKDLVSSIKYLTEELDNDLV